MALSKGFTALTQIAPYDLYRFAMDGFKQETAKHTQSWEMREAGSLAGVLDAYAFILPKVNSQARYAVEDILFIHKKCTENVSNIGSILNHSYGRFRMSAEGVKFNMKCTKAGLKHFIHEEVENWQFWISRNRGLKDISRIRFPDMRNFSTFYVSVLVDRDPDEIRELEQDLYQRICPDDFKSNEYTSIPLFCANIYENNAELTTIITQTLTQMYDDLQQSPDASERALNIICSAIQKLERMHPFIDGNCRTFCMVLLNGLLMQHGFKPAILNDPNDFDGHSIEELVALVKQGIARTDGLLLHPTDINDVDDAPEKLIAYASKFIGAIREQQRQDVNERLPSINFKTNG